MKKTIFQLCALLFVCTLVTSCSKEPKYADEYIEACSENDFGKARMILDKMKAHGYDMEEHEEYVNQKEIMYLISQNDENSIDRLMFLLKEAGENRMSDEDIADLAVEQKNTYLLNKLLSTQISLFKNAKVRDCYKTNEQEDYERLFSALKDTLYMNLDTDMPSIRPKGTYYSDHDPMSYYRYNIDDGQFGDCTTYMEKSSKLNDDCLVLINLCIEDGDEMMAINTFKKMKKGLDWNSEFNRSSVKYKIQITHNSNDIDKARDLILEAQRTKKIPTTIKRF